MGIFCMIVTFAPPIFLLTRMEAYSGSVGGVFFIIFVFLGSLTLSQWFWTSVFYKTGIFVKESCI